MILYMLESLRVAARTRHPSHAVAAAEFWRAMGTWDMQRRDEVKAIVAAHAPTVATLLYSVVGDFAGDYKDIFELELDDGDAFEANFEKVCFFVVVGVVFVRRWWR